MKSRKGRLELRVQVICMKARKGRLELRVQVISCEGS